MSLSVRRTTSAMNEAIGKEAQSYLQSDGLTKFESLLALLSPE